MHRFALSLAVFAAMITAAAAQTPPAASADPAQATPAPVASQPAVFWRWVEPLTFGGGLMHQSLFDRNGASTFSQLRAQYQTSLRVRLEPRGRLSITGGGGTGTSFRSGWNHTSVGSQPAVSSLYVKQLFLTARPTPKISVHVGSIPGYRGYASEVTSFDNDSWVTGARLSLQSKAHLWFDEVVLTRAHLGDFNIPNAFDRMKRLSHSNYAQIVGARKLNAAAFSIELAERDHMRTVGGTAQVKHVPLLTTLRVESSVAVSGGDAHSVALIGERVFPKLTIAVGALSVDDALGTFNGDRYTSGERVFVNTSWRPRPETVICLFVGRGIGSSPEPRTRVDALVLYDVIQAFKGGR